MPSVNPVYANLIEDIKSLPEEYTSQIIDFVGYLKEKVARKQADVISEGCPVCAKHRDPITGEEQFNTETRNAIKEVDDMLAGKIPNTLKTFTSLEEMLEDLDSDD